MYKQTHISMLNFILTLSTPGLKFNKYSYLNKSVLISTERMIEFKE